VDAAEHDDRRAGVQAHHMRGAIVLRKIDPACSQRFVGTFSEWRFHVLDVGEPFGFQQRFGDIQRCEARDRRVLNADSSGLDRRLGSRERRQSVDQAGGAERFHQVTTPHESIIHFLAPGAGWWMCASELPHQSART